MAVPRFLLPASGIVWLTREIGREGREILGMGSFKAIGFVSVWLIPSWFLIRTRKLIERDRTWERILTAQIRK